MSEDINQDLTTDIKVIPTFSFNLGHRSELFLRLLKTLKYFSRDFVLIMKPESMESRVLDESHVSMLNFVLEKTAFETYSIEGGQFCACLDVDEVYSKLSRGLRSNKRVQIIFKPNEQEGDLCMNFEGNRLMEYTMKFQIESASPPDIPKVDFKSKLRMNASLLRDTLEDIRIVSDKVKLISSQDGLEFVASSDNDSAKSVILSGSYQTYDFTGEANCEAEYDINRIITFLDSMKPAVIDLEFGNQAPLRIHEEFRSGSYNFGYVAMYLAPMVNE
jgi:proliferating cell nuclear antigen